MGIEVSLCEVGHGKLLDIRCEGPRKYLVISMKSTQISSSAHIPGCFFPYPVLKRAEGIWASSWSTKIGLPAFVLSGLIAKAASD